MTRDGYSEVKIKKDMFVVKYRHKESEIAYKLFLKRSAEIAQQHNYSHFTVKSINKGQESIGFSTGIHSLKMAEYEGRIKLTNNPAGEETYKALEILAIK